MKSCFHWNVVKLKPSASCNCLSMCNQPIRTRKSAGNRCPVSKNWRTKRIDPPKNQNFPLFFSLEKKVGVPLRSSQNNRKQTSKPKNRSHSNLGMVFLLLLIAEVRFPHGEIKSAGSFTEQGLAFEPSDWLTGNVIDRWRQPESYAGNSIRDTWGVERLWRLLCKNKKAEQKNLRWLKNDANL